MQLHTNYILKYNTSLCPCCQKKKLLIIPVHAHGFTTSTYSPMDCLNIDFIGPFPDKEYILVIVCKFKRWVELYATIDVTAQTTAECLLHNESIFNYFEK